jgi:hypothetical protein
MQKKFQKQFGEMTNKTCQKKFQKQFGEMKDKHA